MVKVIMVTNSFFIQSKSEREGEKKRDEKERKQKKEKKKKGNQTNKQNFKKKLKQEGNCTEIVLAH